jgi:geranylgeranyl reductase family protein
MMVEIVAPLQSDITVVGAGPAGSFAALHAAREGAQVTICEEHSQVGVPLHCTGHISLEGLRRLKLNLPDKVFENKIRSAIFYSPSGREFSVRYDSDVTCVVDRTLFDQHILNMAVRFGVNLLMDTHVDAFSFKGGGVNGVVIRRERGVKSIPSKVVIDAEGVSSNILRRLNLACAKKHTIVSGVQAEFDKVADVRMDTVEVFLGRNFAPGFFAWIVPRRNGTVKVGLVAYRRNPRQCLHNFIHDYPTTRGRFKRSQLMRVAYHPITLGGPINRTYAEGLLVVGDAASHVKPTTGGGIIMGLLCAKIASKVAVDATRQDDSSARFLSQYEHQWKQEISLDMKLMRYARILLNRLTDRKLDQLIGFCSALELDQTLKNVGDIDFPVTSLLHTSEKHKILATLLYFLATSLI